MNHYTVPAAVLSSGHGVILTCLLMLQLQLCDVSAILTDPTSDGCSLVQCQLLQVCPDDSLLKYAGISSAEIFDEDYSEQATINPFDVLQIDALVPVQFHSEEPLPLTGLSLETSTGAPLALNRRKRQALLSQQQLLLQCCSDYKCACRRCPEVPHCGRGQVAVEVHAAHGSPGDCCSSYRCVPKVQCGLALQSYWRDTCTKCSCFGVDELCHNHCPNDEPKDEHRHKNCYSEYLQQPMPHSATWYEDDYCSECSCQYGERSCLISSCVPANCQQPIKVKGKCCPVCPAADASSPRWDANTTRAIQTPEITETTDAAYVGSGSSSTEALWDVGSSSSSIGPTPAASEAMFSNTAETAITASSVTTAAPTSNTAYDSDTRADLSSTPTTETQATGADTATTANDTATDSSTADDAGPSDAASSTTEPNSTSSSSSSSSKYSTADVEFDASTTTTTPNSSASDGSSSSLADSATWTAAHSVSESATSTERPDATGTDPSPSLPTSDGSESTSESTTAAAPLEPKPTSYRQSDPEFVFNAAQSNDDYNNVSTQQQMRNIFNEIDSMVVVALLLGAILCVALALIVRHTKNRKKFYSTIPNSETSLSQTSTHTVLIV